MSVLESPSRLRININTASAPPVPTVGTFDVTVKASANLKNAAGTSPDIDATSPKLSGSFGAIAGPQLVSAVIDDPDGTLEGATPPFLDAGDKITLRTNIPTNTPGGSGVQLKAAVDGLL